MRDSAEWSKAIDRILSRHGSNPAAGWRERFEAAAGQFQPLEGTLIHTHDETDRAGVLARVASISFIADLPEADRDAVLAEVARIVDGRLDAQAAATLVTPHRIEVCWTHKR